MKYILITLLLFAGACKKLNPPPEYVEVSKYILKGDNFSKDNSDIVYCYLYNNLELKEIYVANTKEKNADITSLTWSKQEFLPDYIYTRYIALEHPPITVLRIVITGK